MSSSRRQRRLRAIEHLEDRRMMALGAALVADINPGPAGSHPGSAADLDGTFYFAATNASGERDLWKVNQASGAATLVKDLPQGKNISRPSELTNVGGTLYFVSEASPGDIPGRLWKSDGTGAGTVLVAEDTLLNPRGLTSFDDTLFYHHLPSGGGIQLWTANGPEGTVKLAQLNGEPYGYENAGGTVFFYTKDGSTGQQNPDEIWKTDGTVAGTTKIRDVGDDRIFDSAELNGRYFVTTNGSAGNDDVASLYKSNGTFGGTQPIFSVTARNVLIGNIVNVSGTLFFTVIEGSGEERTISLWKSNGFSGGTVKVADTELETATGLANVNGVLWFSGSDSEHGSELWTSDGTAAGTRLLIDFNPGPGDGFPETTRVTVVGDTAFLRATDGVHGLEVWASDGTPAGTQMLTNTPDDGPITNSPRILGAAGGTLYLSVVDELHGRELWKITDQAAPTLGGGGTAKYVEHAPPLTIWPGALVTDPDSPNFKFGELRLAIAAGFDVNDRLWIKNQGTGAGQIGLIGPRVTYGGMAIGTSSVGPDGTLTVLFNHNATPTAVQALVHALAFVTLGDNPSTLPRTLELQVSDGDGGTSNVMTKTINVVGVNDPPRLILGGQVSYKNNTPPILLAPSATVSDADSANFAGGLLTVAITSGGGPGNRLWVSGAYSLQGNRLLRNGVLMGTVGENGNGWNNLKLRFNTHMTAPLVQELVRSLRFRTVNNTNLSPRTIEFTLTDGDGGVSAKQTKRVNLTA